MELMRLLAVAIALAAAPLERAARAAPPVPPATSAAAANVGDFDWAVAAVRANYSGWDGKTAGRAAEVEALTARLRARAAVGDPAALRAALGEWIAWFRDGHLQFSWAGAEGAAPPPTPPADAPGDALALSRVDAQTLLLRVPSFGPENAPALRALLDARRTDLARAAHLVIDLRENGGGSDFTYAPLRPLFYTRPIYRIGVEMRASPENARLLDALEPRLRPLDAVVADSVADTARRMRAAGGGFIRGEDWPFRIIRLDAAAANPRRVAVLIDGAASSAENFILEARQSRKVTLIGRRNSAGVLDHGNMLGTDAPSGRFTLFWATSRTLRLPHDPVDPDGIAPDVRVPDGADPVRFAADLLARGD